MDDNVRFMLLRHGQTEANKLRVLQGWLDYDLDKTGIMQAECAAEYLKDFKIDMVFSSDLKRAVRTAQIATKYHPELEIKFTPELREWKLGDFQGMNLNDIHSTCPELMKCFTMENADVAIPNGETRHEFQARVQSFMEMTAKQNPGKTILICTHGGAMQRIFRMATGIIADNNKIPIAGNASISCINYLADRKGWHITEWNIKHFLEGRNIEQTILL